MAIQVIHGDCLDVLPTLEAESVHAVVTDPPYHLTSIVKRFGREGSAPAAAGVYGRSSKGFMGKTWDGGDIAFRPETWVAVLRVMKPGAHLVAFGGTRTSHRMTCAIEDAGFEIRDTLCWLYGSGFPKSHDVSRGIDRMGGQPLAAFAALLDSLIHKAGFNYTELDRALGIPSAGSNSCYWVRDDYRGGLPPRHYYEKLKGLLSPPPEFTDLYDLAEREVIAIEIRKNAPSGIVGCGREASEINRKITSSATNAAKEWVGWGSALKPAFEPIILARKPLDGTIAANTLKHGAGGINIDAGRVETDECDRAVMDNRSGAGESTDGWGHIGSRAAGEKFKSHALGRWPANVLHDGSDEVMAAFAAFGKRSSGKPGVMRKGVNGGACYGAESRAPGTPMTGFGDSGSAARFFYTAKADSADRADSKHPTVKPVDLIRWLVQLITPPGGTVLDPFAGSGTTGEAAMLLGFDCTMIERDVQHVADIRHRIKRWSGLDMPLFAEPVP